MNRIGRLNIHKLQVGDKLYSCYSGDVTILKVGHKWATCKDIRIHLTSLLSEIDKYSQGTQYYVSKERTLALCKLDTSWKKVYNNVYRDFRRPYWATQEVLDAIIHAIDSTQE